MFSKYKDGRDLLVHLKEALEAKGFRIEPVSYDEVYRKLISRDQSEYISKLVKFLFLSCYRHWTSEGRDEEKKENFCHYCGKKAARITFRKPVEYECWKILK